MQPDRAAGACGASPHGAPAAPRQILEWLAEVPDPEIPVISIVDLGIVRGVDWEASADGPRCVVTVTPTYSGCPATAVIGRAIEQALTARGIERVRLATRLAPAWTTDWLSEAGRRALADYGIAPPSVRAVQVSGLQRRRDEPPVACPRCGSARTRLISQFGSTPCKALHQCMACREPFDRFKPH